MPSLQEKRTLQRVHIHVCAYLMPPGRMHEHLGTTCAPYVHATSTAADTSCWPVHEDMRAPYPLLCTRTRARAPLLGLCR